MKLKIALAVLLIAGALVVSGCCCCCAWPSHRSYRLPYVHGLPGEHPGMATPAGPSSAVVPSHIK